MTFPLNLESGLAQPVKQVEPQRTDLLDFVNGQTVEGARYIDPLTQDFQVSSDNHFEGMNAVDQEVLLAISTTLNSSSLNGFGQGFNSIKMITPDITNQVNSILNNTLRYLIGNNSINLSNISVINTQSGQISVQFVYNNNTTGISAPIQYILR